MSLWSAKMDWSCFVLVGLKRRMGWFFVSRNARKLAKSVGFGKTCW